MSKQIVEEIVPSGKVIWQSDAAKTYQCPVCQRPVFSQYEGDEKPSIECQGSTGHTLQWK